MAAHGAADGRPPALVLAARSRSAADRKQRGPTNGTVALPTRSTVGQGYLVRVGDSDLLATDASTLRFGILRRWVYVGHLEQHIRRGVRWLDAGMQRRSGIAPQ